MSIGGILILPDFKPSVKSVMLIEVTAPCWRMAADEDSELFLSRVFSFTVSCSLASMFYQECGLVQANRKLKM